MLSLLDFTAYESSAEYDVKIKLFFAVVKSEAETTSINDDNKMQTRTRTMVFFSGPVIKGTRFYSVIKFGFGDFEKFPIQIRLDYHAAASLALTILFTNAVTLKFADMLGSGSLGLSGTRLISKVVE